MTETLTTGTESTATRGRKATPTDGTVKAWDDSDRGNFLDGDLEGRGKYRAEAEFSIREAEGGGKIRMMDYPAGGYCPLVAPGIVGNKVFAQFFVDHESAGVLTAVGLRQAKRVIAFMLQVNWQNGERLVRKNEKGEETHQPFVTFKNQAGSWKNGLKNCVEYLIPRVKEIQERETQDKIHSKLELLKKQAADAGIPFADLMKMVQNA